MAGWVPASLISLLLFGRLLGRRFEGTGSKAVTRLEGTSDRTQILDLPMVFCFRSAGTHVGLE